MKNDFVLYITEDLLAKWGATARAMFGGYGIKIDGITMAIIVDDNLYFKVDVSNKADYEKYDMKPFMYSRKNGKQIAMSYWQVPPDVLEDPYLFQEFVEKSLEVAKSKQKR